MNYYLCDIYINLFWVSILPTASPETDRWLNSNFLSNLSISISGYNRCLLIRDILRIVIIWEVKEWCSKQCLSTPSATAVWRLTYKSNFWRQVSSSSRSNLFSNSLVIHPGCVCAVNHLVYYSLSLSLFRKRTKRYANVEKKSFIEMKII